MPGELACSKMPQQWPKMMPNHSNHLFESRRTIQSAQLQPTSLRLFTHKSRHQQIARDQVLCSTLWIACLSPHARFTTLLDQYSLGSVSWCQPDRLSRASENPMNTFREYTRAWGLSSARMRATKPGVLVMHPGPANRGVEIAPEVADGPRSVMRRQAANGVAVRMAVLRMVTGMTGGGTDG